MKEANRAVSHAVSRRNFLALASGSAALLMTGWPKAARGRTCSCAQAERAVSPGANGITPEHFEKARQRAAAMVAKMTLPEKISQFGAQAPAVPRLNLPAFNYYASEALHGLIHEGPVTSFPLPLALGCSWNRSLVQRVFTTASDEIWAWHKKNGLGLAMFSPPTVNMGTRDPRWGRIGENYSEDPYLVGQMAIYTIRGMQGNDSRYLKTIACAKHFMANDTDDDREETSAAVDPRSFWEYYTRSFEICVREGQVFTVMTSYNAMNGIPTSANRFLLTDVLRDRWGFRGYVVSDCDAIGDICRTHHFVPTYPEAAALAVNAGCDINCGDTLPNHLAKAVDEMLISEAALDRSLIRSFTGRVLLGEYDPPEQIPYSRTPISCLESPAHRQLAREAARQSVVLFKNDNNTLPLDKSKLKKIAVIGPMADSCELGNYGGIPQSRVSPLKGIGECLGIPNLPAYRKGASDFAQSASGLRREMCSEGGDHLSNITNGSWAAYSHVLLTGASEFQARVASQGSGGSVEVHLDSLSGPLAATLKVPSRGADKNWVNVSAPLRPAGGEHTLYLRFLGEGGRLFNLQSFSLTPAKPLTTGAVQVAYALGCTVLGDKDPALFDEAVRMAREADAALVFVGADEQVDTEGRDRSHLHLPGAQHELVQSVYAANPRTILVVSSNCPVAVNWEQDNLPAIVGGLVLGQEQGPALAEVLFGDYNPGGKVSTTWYRRVEDLPDFHDYNIRNGRTYMYFRGNPLYPFGHGLSYTTFRYENLRASQNTLESEGKVTVSFAITNVGSRDGDEIPQLYIRFGGGAVERPIKQLVNFDRVPLKAGETKTVSFELLHEDRALRYWDESKYEFVVESGPLDIMIGASSADIRLKTQIQLAA